MEKLRQVKTYKLLKRFFFIIINIILRILNLKNREYYYSKWVVDDADENRLVKYPLNENSIIVDIGGYKGFFSDKIIDLYNPYVIIFEPVKKFYRVLERKYKKNLKIKIYNLGLSDKNSFQKIYLSNDGTSLVKVSSKSEKIKLFDATTFFRKLKSIDLLSINIEGAEYDVLERIIQTKLIKKIKFLQIQFHSFVPDAFDRRSSIIKKIAQTHNVYYSYPFVWESFKLKR